jgi:MYND finger
MRLSHTLIRQRRTPCFPQIDLTFRAILYEKRPRFLVLFSHQTTSYSQIFFTHPSYVPEEDIFYDYPTGCPNPCCTDDCEMIRFPRRGQETASVLEIKRKGRFRRVKPKQMCNWIDCDVSFSQENVANMSGSSEGSEISVDSQGSGEGRMVGQTCSKCKLVKYCSPEHQRKDWDEHRRVCVKPLA